MSIAAAVGGVGGVFIAPTKRERERESSFFFGRKFRISFYFLICFINPNGGLLKKKKKMIVQNCCLYLLLLNIGFRSPVVKASRLHREDHEFKSHREHFFF